METITVVKTLDRQLADLIPGADELVGREVEITIRPAEPPKPEPRRRGGWAQGKIWTSDDFDEPLDEFKDYM